MPESPIDTSHIARRTPVLTAESAQKFSSEKIDKQWMMVTEAVKRDLPANTVLRDALLTFTSTPLSESMPSQVLQEITKADGRVGKLLSRYDTQLGEFVELPAVPDNAFVPDISRSEEYFSPEDLQKRMVAYKYTTDEIQHRLKRMDESGQFVSKASTVEEKALAIARYKFARDIKVLSLGAEILSLDSPPVFTNGVCELQSGIRMTVDPNHLKDAEILTSPLAWEKRRQIKDRVYEITAGGKNYILKERKTSRHRDTTEGGHKPTLSSAREFMLASLLHDKGTTTKGDVSVQWERPVGFVEYPDGYQFAIFEFIPGMSSNDRTGNTAHQIIQNIDTYKEEFDELSDVCNPLFTDDSQSQESPRSFLKFWKRNKKFPSLGPLSISEFAEVKKRYLHSQASELRNKVLLENNIGSADSELKFVSNVVNGRVQLGLIEIDLEYFYPRDPNKLEEVQKRHEEFAREDEESMRRHLPKFPKYEWDRQDVAYWEYIDLQRAKSAETSTTDS